MKRFFNLKFGEKFVIDGVIYQKENFFSAVRSFGTREFSWSPSAPLYRDFWPWQKVTFPKASRIEATLNGNSPFASPPTLGQRIMTREAPPHIDDERTGPSC